MLRLRCLGLTLFALSVAACGEDDSSSTGTGAIGGGSGSGGAAATGGTGALSGSGGGGGAQASGGSGTLGSGGGGTSGSGGSGTVGSGGSGGQAGCPAANTPYPAGPYGGKLGSVFPNLPWAGHVSEAADAVATGKPWVDYSLDEPRRACKGYALVHISEFG